MENYLLLKLKYSKMKSPMSAVIDHYNKTAKTYCERTVSFDMSADYARFFKYLNPGATILDAGCGPGRDAKAFMEHGFLAQAIDGSIEMVKFASEHLQRPVSCISFEEMEFVECFDGIWANASLLHTHPEELNNIFSRFIRALKPNGYWFMSFKHGVGVQMKGSIPCYLQTEHSLKSKLGLFPELRVEEMWVFEGMNAKREPTDWISCIVQKQIV